MAYNTYTKLLLKFNESNGSTSTSDSSQGALGVTLNGSSEISSAQGKFSTNSLMLGDPSGSGSAGSVTVNSPSSVFSTSTSSHKQFDFWFYREANSPWGIQPLVNVKFNNGDTVLLWRGSTSYELEINNSNTNGDYIYQSYTDYGGYQSWVHLRVAIYGSEVYVGLDGSQIIYASSPNSYDLWAGSSGNAVTEFRVGSWPASFGQDANVFVRGWVDAYQVLEGDTTWFGGSYTVPTAEPDSYSGGGPVSVSLTGQSFSVSQGAIAPNRSRALTGQSYSYSQGTITPSIGSNVTVSLTGQAVTFAQGALGKSRTRALSGQAYSYSQGTITTVVGVTVALTGQALSISQGALGKQSAVTLSGQSVGLTQGALSQSRSVSLSGVSATVSVGVLAPSLTKALTGQSNPIVPGSIFVGTLFAGGNTVDNVTSKGVFGDPPNDYDLYTTLMLHFNTAGLLTDSSLYGHTVIDLDGLATQNTTPPMLGDGSISFPTTNVNGLEVVPSGVFNDATTDKVIDFVVKPTSRAGTNQNLFYVTFPGTAYSGGSCYIALEVGATDGRLYLTVRTPSVSVTSQQTSAVITYGARNWIRLAFVGGTCYLCHNGTQISTVLANFGNVWPNTYHKRLQIGLYAYGTLDEYRIQEGSSANTGYSGGNYTVNSGFEWFPNAILASGSNTLEAVTSDGFAHVDVVLEAVGSNTVDPVTSEGNANVGVWIEAVGNSTLQDITSDGYATVAPVIYANSNVTTDAVTSTGSSELYWSSAGSNTVDNVTSTGAGTVANAVWEGYNTVDDVTCVGVVSVIATALGGNTTDAVTSSGELLAYWIASGANTTVDIISSGIAVLGRSANGSITLDPITNEGSAFVSVSGIGWVLIEDVVSTGSAESSIYASGGNVTDDITSGYGRPEEIPTSKPFIEFVFSKTEGAYVRR